MPMDVMSLFRKQAPQQPTNQGPSQGQGNNPNANNGGQGQGQGQNNQQGGQGIQGPGSLPGNNNGQQGGGQNTQNSNPPTGIDKFSKMWDTPTTEGDKAPAFNLDPKVLKEVAGSQDFMQGIDPELMQKATSGDTQSLIQLMNNVAQSAYARSLEHGSTLTDKFVGAREGFSSKQLGNQVRGEMTTSALSSIPNFKHPAVQRQLKSTAEQLQRMHPDATPQEIVQMTIEYHQELAAAMAPEDKSAKNGKPATADGERGEEYWDKYFSADQQQG